MNKWRWLSRRPWVMALLLLVLVTGPPAFVLWQFNERQQAVIQCFTDAFDKLVARSEAIEGPARERTTALEDIFRALRPSGPGQPPNREAGQEAYQRFLETSDRLRDAQDKNPIPPRPKVTCNS